MSWRPGFWQNTWSILRSYAPNRTLLSRIVGGKVVGTRGGGLAPDQFQHFVRPRRGFTAQLCCCLIAIIKSLMSEIFDRDLGESYMAQRVLITAGASGIGKEIAKAFAAIGASVCVCDIDVKALETQRGIFLV